MYKVYIYNKIIIGKKMYFYFVNQASKIQVYETKENWYGYNSGLSVCVAIILVC